MFRHDHDSIFGSTYQGVPNPLVPHHHPYPTRYHGPIWTTPRFMLPYRERPYAKAPYAGLDGACGCGGMKSLGEASPDGLGAPALCLSTGIDAVDIALGAVVGALVSPKAATEDRLAWAAGGALAAWLAGLVGVGIVGGTGLYMRSQKS